MYISKINLTSFRNYDAARIDLSVSGKAPAKMVGISGDNGAGKTNILEAVSLLSPGRGLRSADLLDIKNSKASDTEVWTVSAEVGSDNEEYVRIGTGLDRNNKRRVVRIDGSDVSSQNELLNFVSVIWLTPQMDRLFIEGTSSRRKFFDRLVVAYEPAHNTRLNRYEKRMRERMKLLQTQRILDEVWISNLEAEMAADAVSIAASRLNLLERLQVHINNLQSVSSLFPIPTIGIDNWIEEEIKTQPAVKVEDSFKEKMRANRQIDRESKRTAIGPHRSDFTAVYKDMPASQGSTGEQKALLVSIILGHALMMQAEKGFVPVILLDEVAAHLDEARREQLFKVLLSLNGQIWLTGTDKEIFNSLNNNAQFLQVENGRIV